MPAKITVLIDKKDSFEVVRDEIAGILVIEQAGQKALATSQSKSTAPYDFNLYVEHATPWTLIEDEDGSINNDTPIVNISFNSMTVDSTKSNTSTSQNFKAEYFIDVYAAKNTEVSATKVITRGDYLSANDTMRLIRIVRNILMNHNYVYMNLPKVVLSRKVSSINMFNGNPNELPFTNLCAARLVLSVEITESTNENVYQTLNLLQAQCTRASDGLVYFDADLLSDV